MRRFRLLISVLAILILFSSCAAGKDPLDYQNGEIEAIITGRAGALDFSATLSLSAMTEAGERDFSLSLHSPESLKGLRITRKGGEVALTLSAVTQKLDSLDAMPRVARLISLFSIAEAPSEVISVKGADAGFGALDSVTRLTFSDAAIYLHRNGTPIKAETLSDGEGPDIVIFIESFN